MHRTALHRTAHTVGRRAIGRTARPMTIVWCSKRNQHTYLFTIGAHSQIDIPKRSSTHSFRNAVFLNKRQETTETRQERQVVRVVTMLAPPPPPWWSFSRTRLRQIRTEIEDCMVFFVVNVCTAAATAVPHESQTFVCFSLAHTLWAHSCCSGRPQRTREGGVGGWVDCDTVIRRP